MIELHKNYNFEGLLKSIVREDEFYQKNDNKFIEKLWVSEEFAIEFKCIPLISLEVTCGEMELSSFYFENDELNVIFEDVKKNQDPINFNLTFEQVGETFKISKMGFSRIAGNVYYNIKNL